MDRNQNFGVGWRGRLRSLIPDELSEARVTSQITCNHCARPIDVDEDDVILTGSARSPRADSAGRALFEHIGCYQAHQKGDGA